MKIRRIAKWAMGIGVAAVVAIAIAAKVRFGSAQELEQWIGRQIVAIVNTFLVPQLSFDEVAYTAPADVALSKVALRSPDGVRLFELEGFELALAETPSMGQPVVIEKVVIDRGRVNLLHDEKSGGLRGFSPFVKSTDADQPIRTEVESQPAQEFRLSDVLRLRLIDLRDIGIRYDPGGDQPPFEIDGISTQLKVEPTASTADRGWYKFDFAVDRGPALHLEMRGRVNLDSHDFELDQGRIAVRVGPETMSSLPSSLQMLLRQYDATGDLDLTVKGNIPTNDPLAGEATAKVVLRDFRVALGERRLIIENLEIEAALGERKMTMKALNGRLLGGELSAAFSVDLGDTNMPAEFSWTGKNLDIGEWRPEGGTPENSLVGLVSTTGSGRAALTGLPQSLSGSGEIQLRDARLVGLPMMSALTRIMKIQVPPSLSRGDRADARFEFTPKGIQIKRIDIVTALVAARGEGLVGYDTGLDIRMNAGPLEKVQSLLGKVGDLLAHATDKLVAYKVEGRIGEPVVRVMVFEQRIGG